MTLVMKTKAAADVPLPGSGRAALFIDAATGLPAAKDADGVVTPLKGADGAPGDDGAGLPTGGTEGQVVTKTADGAAWADPPAGGTEPTGTWMSLLPPDGSVVDYKTGESLTSASFSGVIYTNN